MELSAIMLLKISQLSGLSFFSPQQESSKYWNPAIVGFCCGQYIHKNYSNV